MRGEVLRPEIVCWFRTFDGGKGVIVTRNLAAYHSVPFQPIHIVVPVSKQ